MKLVPDFTKGERKESEIYEEGEIGLMRALDESLARIAAIRRVAEVFWHFG